ncbi:Oidioi.mRNA.OKI2018_I69.XSR.g14606.t1.cds [Oikopleura dioica]|uniref:Oidioi.mRNA.OKI2018_I69.XSR.g14606.t1.cds n=1 Tax=Oikopleura dioica TaxID=34765 RepID=A0ABN7SHL6_OIKDI|nr:Oidioi.mRNA.OKI2018_I69.XSR.g14606.t1.cds [Oikopleura dioica]
MSGLSDPQKDLTVLTFLALYILGVCMLVLSEYVHEIYQGHFEEETKEWTGRIDSAHDTSSNLIGLRDFLAGNRTHEHHDEDTSSFLYENECIRYGMKVVTEHSRLVELTESTFAACKEMCEAIRHCAVWTFGPDGCNITDKARLQLSPNFEYTSGMIRGQKDYFCPE